MRFDFTTSPLVLFGAGRRRDVGPLAQPWGKRVLLVTGAQPSRADPVRQSLLENAVEPIVFPVNGEPSVATVLDGLRVAREAACNGVVAVGGGSAIDAAKAVAGLCTNPGDPLDYLEVVGRGRSLGVPALPWIAVPTTAGTGAEVTRNAVLAVPERGVKVSLRSPLLLPRAAVIDPELTLGSPPAVTAASGMDALTQLIEAYVCNRATPLTDALCSQALPPAARALPAAWREPAVLEHREALCFASFCSGLALANAGLGAVHGFASPIGGRFGAPHGAVCAALLAPVMSVNLQALRTRSPGHPALARYQQVAAWLTGDPQAQAEDGVEWVRTLVVELQIPSLRRFGVSEADAEEIVARARQASSSKANPIELDPAEWTAALRPAI